MIVVGDEEVLEYLSRCVKIAVGIYACGIDFLLVKGITLASLADHAFAFTEALPVLDVECRRWLMYYGTIEPKFTIADWKRVESQGQHIVYNCIEDLFDYYEVEDYIFKKVPLTMFGFGSVNVYRRLIDLASRESLYMLKRFY